MRENDTGLCINPRCSLTPIIKAVGRQCNLRCAYCFYHNTDQATPNVMSVEMLESFIRQYMELYAGPVCFVWHGGEPLLAWMEFYRKAVALQREFAREGQRMVETVKTCMELWRARDDDRLCIREIESYIAGALRKRSRHCSFNRGCRNYFYLDFDGGIYPCDSMTGDPGLRFGDLRTQPLADILASGSRASYLKSIERVDEECSRCRWYSVCHNGCPAERVGRAGEALLLPGQEGIARIRSRTCFEACRQERFLTG